MKVGWCFCHLGIFDGVSSGGFCQAVKNSESTCLSVFREAFSEFERLPLSDRRMRYPATGPSIADGAR